MFYRSGWLRCVVFKYVCVRLSWCDVFGLLYYYFRDDFKTQVKEEFTVLDYLFLSTTIQAGVGISDIYPITTYGKIAMITQQFIMIMTHVFTIYVFNL